MSAILSTAWSLGWKTTVLALVVHALRRDHLRGKRSILLFASLVVLLLAASAMLPVARVPVPGLVLLPPPRTLLVLLSSVMIGGTLILLGRFVRDLRRVRAVTRAGTAVTEGAWREALDVMQSRLVGSKASLVAADVGSPFTWGFRDPVVVIPAALASGPVMPGVLRHELEHVARRDWLRLVVVRVADALLFWLPASWLLLRWHESESEAACDAAVIADGLAPDEYGREILRCAGHATLGAAAGMGGRRSLLARRLFAILEQVPPGRPPRVATVAALVLLAALIAPLRFGAPALVVPVPHAGESPGEAAARLLRALDDPELAPVIAVIESRDLSHRRREPGTLDHPAALGPLALATHDPDPVVRLIAVWALGEMRYPTSLPVILPRLDDVSPAVRAEACMALADVPFVPVTAPLLLRLDDPDPGVRRAAAHALGDRRDAASRDALERRLLDADDSVRDEVRWALSQL